MENLTETIINMMEQTSTSSNQETSIDKMKRMGPLSTHKDEDKFEVMKITLKNNRSTWNFNILYQLNFIFHFLMANNEQRWQAHNSG